MTRRLRRSKQTDSRDNATNGFNRRSFVKLIPTLGAAGVFASTMPLGSLLGIDADEAFAVAAQQQPQQPPARVTKEMLKAAEQIAGIEFTDPHRDMALAGVNRNLASYETLRKIDVPLDTDPAFWFHPALPGKRFNMKKAAIETSRAEIPQFKSVDDLAFATLAQLAELVRTRKVTSTELTKMYLERLKKYGPKLLCVVTLTEELALKQAADADAEIKRGKYRGPLHGIPCGIKDLFSTKGIKTTWGAEPFRDQMIDYDSTVVERLRNAGAVLVAKLSMGALAQGGRWFAGVTRNPWQPEEDRQGSSGSSAGSASATSAGLVGFAIGTETLGSIVSPSSRCGVVGLRPTYGRISRYGAMGLSWTMDKIGPLCRGVEDCALVLNALYGPDDRDITVTDIPFNYNAEVPLAKMRIGFVKTEFEPRPNPNANAANQAQAEERKKMYATALEALRGAGADLKDVELPTFQTNSLRFLLSAEAATAFDDITRDGRVNQLSGQEAGDWPNSFRTSRFIPAVEYIRAQRARTVLMREMDRFIEKWDVIVTPAPGSASLLITNLTGHPAVCLKSGFINNLPQSIMFTSKLYDEGAALRVALAFEKATKWHEMNPKME